jgi:hypothetical protein
MTGEIRTKYCKPTWNTLNVYVVIDAPLIIVINFIGSANILLHPTKNIWNNAYMILIIEISLF